jgi:hypothetical protein
MGISSARDLLQDWYGDSLVCNIVETDITLGGQPQRIAQQDPAVISRSVTNNGIGLIFVSSRSTVFTNQGIPIAAGTTLQLFALEDFDLASCDLFAFSVAGGNPVHVISIQVVGQSD